MRKHVQQTTGDPCDSEHGGIRANPYYPILTSLLANLKNSVSVLKLNETWNSAHLADIVHTTCHYLHAPTQKIKTKS